MTSSEQLAEFARMQRENEQLKQQLASRPAPSAAGPAQLSFKVSAKRGVSVYGLGRWPTTLYGGQWQRLLARAADIAAFIDAHRDELDWKGDE